MKPEERVRVNGNSILFCMGGARGWMSLGCAEAEQTAVGLRLAIVDAIADERIVIANEASKWLLNFLEETWFDDDVGRARECDKLAAAIRKGNE